MPTNWVYTVVKLEERRLQRDKVDNGSCAAERHIEFNSHGSWLKQQLCRLHPTMLCVKQIAKRHEQDSITAAEAYVAIDDVHNYTKPVLVSGNGCTACALSSTTWTDLKAKMRVDFLGCMVLSRLATSAVHWP